MGLLAVLFGEGAVDWLDGGLVVDRVDESDGRDELLEEEELDWLPWLESPGGGDRPQSVLPLEAAFDESRQ